MYNFEFFRDFCLARDTKIEVFEGAKSNLPDDQAHHAALAILDLVSHLTEKDLLIVLVSGTRNYLKYLGVGVLRIIFLMIKLTTLL